MRLSPFITVLAALLAVIVFGFIGARIVRPNRALLSDSGLSVSRITPNADGSDDVTTVRYTLNQNAKVTIDFTNRADGQHYVFRNAEARPADSYQVQFGGVVDG